MKPKTIQYQRTRKINPALIDPKYQYGSEEVSFGAWADISDESEISASNELRDYVDTVIQEQIEKIVSSLREKANQNVFSWATISVAFTELMNTQNMNSEQIGIGLDKLLILLKTKR